MDDEYHCTACAVHVSVSSFAISLFAWAEKEPFCCGNLEPKLVLGAFDGFIVHIREAKTNRTRKG